MGKLADRVADLANVPSRVASRAAVEIQSLMDEQFNEGRDPYGTAWEPLAESTTDRGRTPPPLTDTRAMRDSLLVRPMAAAGLQITIDHPAAPHQTGWEGKQGKGPARPILPARSELPSEWQGVIEDLVAQEFRK